MSYVIGVSSGYFSVTGQEERIHLIGLFKKAQSCITKGVQFVQLDLESISEFEEPNLKERIENEIKKKLGIEFGIHSETKAAGVEAAELDSAIGIEYERAHKRIIDILKKSAEIGAKYVLIHASESDPFPMLALRTQPSDLVDIYGRPLRDFLNTEKKLLEWIIEGNGKFIWVEILGRSLEEYLRLEQESFIRAYKLRFEGKTPTEQEIIERINEEKESLKKYFQDMVSSKSLHYGPERWAYFLIAKWMEINNDNLWKNIIDISIEFFAKRAGMTVEEWKKEKKITTYSIDDENFRDAHEIWVPAVAAKYIWGHFNPPKESKFEDPKTIIKKANMPLVLESPMGGRGIEEWLRLANPLQFYYLCKEVGFDYMQIALDFEHMLSIRLDPEIVISLFPEDGGKIVKVIHAGWPATLAPAHFPIQLGSDQQFYLYKMYYQLRQKGFGKDPTIDHFIIFERGGPETFQESILSLRNIVEFLKKDTPPEALSPEFSGIETGQIASWERQLTTIKEHVEEPLKDLLAVPEEEYGFFSRASVEKGVAEKWKKEELK